MFSRYVGSFLDDSKSRKRRKFCFLNEKIVNIIKICPKFSAAESSPIIFSSFQFFMFFFMIFMSSWVFLRTAHEQR